MNDTYTQADFRRVQTGVAGLDTVTRGGLLEGGMYLILGKPGSGKTVLGNQMCFEHVRNGSRAAYVTLLNETHSRLLQYISGFNFFDPAAVGQRLQYVSGYGALEARGLSGLLEMLQGVIRDQQVTLVVIDGISATDDFPKADLGVRAFLQKLHVYSEAHACTVVFISHTYMLEKTRPEHTMVDGLIEFDSSYSGMRLLQEIEVSKLRGSDHIRGRHAYQITDEGLVVYPRTESVLRNLVSSTDFSNERLMFGVGELDKMLNGGIVAQSTSIIYGVPGTGKTMLGMHFLASGAQNGEPGLYFGFYERPERLIRNAQSVGLDFERYVKEGTIEMMWQQPLEGIIDLLAERLLDAVRKRGVKRLFIDGYSGYERADYPGRLIEYLVALTSELRSIGVTTLLAVEMSDIISPSLAVPVQMVSAVADNIVVLRFVELRSQLYRLISLLKVRESGYDSSVREFTISSRGITVAETFGSAEAILTGVAGPPPLA